MVSSLVDQIKCLYQENYNNDFFLINATTLLDENTYKLANGKRIKFSGLFWRIKYFKI